MIDRADIHQLETLDPRLDATALRHLRALDAGGSVLLVGVAHDHPASVFRTTWLVDHLSPATLALELPTLALPLFERYASDELTPPRHGGEMSAAIQAANPDTVVVGVNGPNRRYALALLSEVVRTGANMDVLSFVFRDLIRGTAHALLCRAGATLGRLIPMETKLYSPMTYEVTSRDPPSEQATHEREHRRKRDALMRAVQVPASLQLIDTVREQQMALRIDRHRHLEDLIAVVGLEHLDPLVVALEDLGTLRLVEADR